MNDIYTFVEDAIEKSKDFKGGTIESILDFPSLYCVAYKPKGAGKGDEYDDSFLSVDKKSGKVSPYNPLLDMKSFSKANEHPIYSRQKEIRHNDAFDAGKDFVQAFLGDNNE
ncbi:MAG: hypothetical protein J6Y02_00885 [Pseudobutyrivibrio sp.]|nr:hypothetical protein [Pseudobutyrivibrio sp.]